MAVCKINCIRAKIGAKARNGFMGEENNCTSAHTSSSSNNRQ